MRREIFTIGSLMQTGFKDYKAARLLIDNKLFIQGLTLASSAVEKYIKAFLTVNGKKPRWVHLDKLKELKKQFGTNYSHILDKLDKNFLSLLGMAYAARYYDTKNDAEHIGFLVSQVLAELDFTINFFENQIETIDTNTGLNLDTAYTIALRERDSIITKDNFIVEGVTKKDYMERPSSVYSLHINPNSYLFEEKYVSSDISVPYDGQVNFFRITKNDNPTAS